MILYHGSSIEIRKPDILHSRRNVDFGRGFYTTPIQKQAEKWCEKFIRRGKDGIVTVYNMDEKVFQTCRILEFSSYSEDWLDFVTSCRMGLDTTEYDLILGGVANDKVFNTCELYFKQYISKDAALSRLRYEKPNQQVCFKNQKVLDEYLRFERSEYL
ncbi:MAG: DUF3990 domain-containing protein [Bacteroides sp.]|nr:DUF3990 domain-containing protein [Bacteroides sp.]MCM1550422.1 DUF3990 domain-containing protein [Clostridium sp.]